MTLKKKLLWQAQPHVRLGLPMSSGHRADPPLWNGRGRALSLGEMSGKGPWAKSVVMMMTMMVMTDIMTMMDVMMLQVLAMQEMQEENVQHKNIHPNHGS